MKRTKAILLLFAAAVFQLSSAFLSVIEFRDSPLRSCYNDRRDSRISKEFVNGQELPLPNSLETLVSLIERYEVLNPTLGNVEIIKRFLVSFRIDDLSPDLTKNALRKTYSTLLNKFHKAFFGIPDKVQYAFAEDDFSNDEKCALHFMLSHTVNDTKRDRDAQLEQFPNLAKHPRENGVVSLHAKWKHAIAINRVLMGLMAGLSGSNKINAADILARLKAGDQDSVRDVQVNRLYAVTISDLVTIAIRNDDMDLLPNGLWNDITCTTEYALNDNNREYLSTSLLRGAIDGLILGKKVEEKPQIYSRLRVSQILRMYYGTSGLPDDQERTSWCTRERIFSNMQELKDEVMNFNKLYKAQAGEIPADNALDKIGQAISLIQGSVFGEITEEAAEECSGSETSFEKRCSSPYDIFAIFDNSVGDSLKIFQQELIGNLSVSFDIRPRGSSVGVYTNSKPQSSNLLDVVANNTGISGCPACFARYIMRSGAKEDEAEVFRDLNETLTEFDKNYETQQNELSEPKAGRPSKIVLYFNYGNPSTSDYQLRDALWEIEKYFREATILAIGNKKESLEVFTRDDTTDVFVESSNPTNVARRLKTRICKAPAEFTFKNCYQNSRGAEADNKQEYFIPLNKFQYWAIYPKYFLKSYKISMKFRALNGGQIRVCFSRSYKKIIEDRTGYEVTCEEGEEVAFTEWNPCHRRTVYSCNPFYFFIEGKKAPNDKYCESVRCSTAKDIQFEFQHDGMSCNMASLSSISSLAFVFALILYFLQKRA
ncbi:uncharacterized protein LOC129216172 isoform X2 [Uloborus diversus]|uniref:uncharacterized protein LOC129216172 isoform X2 n=1 Tax=Uloborus diversus TaxID=327109 RepID=UPI0024098D10|nr:uncharacterized protein LOC129216172 isoform X2 [Uloborus diversus]